MEINKIEKKKIRQNLNIIDAILYKLQNKLSYKEIEKQTGIPKSTIHGKIQDIVAFFDPEKIKRYEDKKGDMLSGAEMMILAKMMDNSKFKKASINNLAYALQNVNNINRLHRGQATAILDSIDNVIDRVERKLRKAIDVTPEVQDNNAGM